MHLRCTYCIHAEPSLEEHDTTEGHGVIHTGVRPEGGGGRVDIIMIIIIVAVALRT